MHSRSQTVWELERDSCMNMASSVEARLKEREEARRAAVQQRKAERAIGGRPEEAAGYFSQQFAAKKAAIEKLLCAAGDVPKEQLPAHFDSLSVQCQALQKFVSDSTIFITSYELRSSQEQMSQLVQELNTKENLLLPKKKFAFKSRKKDSQLQTTGVDVRESGERERGGGRGGERQGHLKVDNIVGFTDRKDEKLSMSADEVKGHDVNLSGLVSCEVQLSGPPSTLHMSRMEGCTVLCGPVSSSVFIEDCKNCTFVTACQQLRVHTTVDSVFYLHVTSRAIIEDCSRVKFAPYAWTYHGIRDHFEAAGIDRDTNHWDTVDDFNWLASSDPSPNWSVLPECERTSWS